MLSMYTSLSTLWLMYCSVTATTASLQRKTTSTRVPDGKTRPVNSNCILNVQENSQYNTITWINTKTENLWPKNIEERKRELIILKKLVTKVNAKRQLEKQVTSERNGSTFRHCQCLVFVADIRAELLITVTDAGIKKSLAVLLALEWNKMRPLLIDRDNRKSPIVSLKPWNWLMCGSLEIDLPKKQQLDH